MEPKRLAQYTKLARKLGISKLTIGDVSIELDLYYQANKKSKTADKVADPVVEEHSSEDLLYWSATGSNI